MRFITEISKIMNQVRFQIFTLSIDTDNQLTTLFLRYTCIQKLFEYCYLLNVDPIEKEGGEGEWLGK